MAATVQLTFRKPSAPDGAGWAPWVGQGSWQGCPYLLQAGPHTTQGGGLFPRRCRGRKAQVATVRVLTGRGLRRPSLPASRAGQRGSSPTLRWTPALPQPVGETDVGGHRQPLVLFCDSLPVTSHGGPCSLGPPSAFQGPAFPQGALTWDHRGRGQRLPTLLLCGEGNRGPQMTFAEFTGPSRRMVRNADLDATQAAIRPPALSSSCCATSCK